MNDWKTKDVIAWILERMGHKLLSIDAKNDINLDLYAKYIKYKYKNSDNLEIKEFINYFL